MLRLQNICYSYDDETPALSEVSLTVCEGERVALLGNNGAGKSTLFLCCNGVLAPQSGSVFLDGREVEKKAADLRRLRQGVGLVFQDPDDQIIAPTVESEVSFGPMNLRLAPAELSKACERALESMNLTAYRARPPHYLSGGEKKRVSIADILAMSPRLMLLDEPTASLDGAHTALLEQTLERLHDEGLALVISTHDVDFAWRWADRAVVLSGGRVAADDDVAQVFASEKLLEDAGLVKPALFELGQTIFPKLPPEQLPRSVAQFKAMVGGKI